MQHRIGMAVTCLHISALLYLLVGGGFFLVSVLAIETTEAAIFGTAMLVFCLALIAGIEVVAYGLNRRKFWAWIAGLCIFGMYAPSLFLPLGVLGLWALLDSGTRKEFGINVDKREA